MDNFHGTNVGNGGANQDRPVTISAARPTCHRFDYNYRAFVDNGTGAYDNLGVKHHTDKMGGIKFYLGSNFGGNAFGYPDYRQCLSSSSTHFVELSNIPTTQVWKPFWKDMINAQEKGENNFGFLFVGGFAALVGTVLAAIYFSNAWIPSLVLLFVVVVLCSCVSDTHTQWRRAIANHQPKFEAVGYRVELLMEITGPPNYRGITPKCYVCHIWKHKTGSTPIGTDLT